MIDRFFKEIQPGKSLEPYDWHFRASLGLTTGETWEDLLKAKRVIIISEAGSGKTYECQTQADLLWKAGDAAFWLELATLATTELRTMLDAEQEARFDCWLNSQSEIATFFLDSYDELRLTPGKFDLALNRLAKAIAGKMQHVRIVVTSRPVPFDEEAIRRFLPVPKVVAKVEPTAENFARIVLHGSAEEKSPDEEDPKPHAEWAKVTLLPLTDDQIVEFSRLRGVDDPGEMLKDLKRRNAEEFARRPQDLIELCADWKDHKRIRTHREQVEGNIRLKLKPRENRREPAELSVAKAMEGARRLALAMMMTRRLTIRHNAESDHGGDEAAFDPRLVLTDWPDTEIKALLERPLFGVASYGRVRFHHRSILEFLAAARLTELRKNGMPARALKGLIFTETRGKTIVRHSKRAIAGWLALEEATIYQTIRDNEPDVLLNEGDPESLAPSQRIETLYAFVKRHGTGGWRGKKVPQIQIHRFASPELAAQIETLWKEGVENPEIRELLLGLIEHGGIAECSEIAYASASDPSMETGERLDALDALAAIGDARLPGIVGKIAAGAPDWSERFAKIAVMRLFPKHLGIDHLFQILGRIRFRGTGSGDLDWFLPTSVKEHPWQAWELEAIRDGLVKLISADLRWQEQWPHYISSNGRLAGLLAVACIRGMEAGVTLEWLRAGVLAMLLAHHEYPENKQFAVLTNVLNDLSAKESEDLFWVTDKLLQALHPELDPLKRFHESRIRWDIKLKPARDTNWIQRSLADTERTQADRAMLLEAAIQITPGEDSWLRYLNDLKRDVGDLPPLVVKIDEQIEGWSTKREPQEWEIESAKRAEEAKRREEEILANWKKFFEKVSTDPDGVFSNEETEVIWNLWRAMIKAGSEEHQSGWNPRFVEDFFSKETSERLRLTMMRFWRSNNPTLKSERPEKERNTYFTRWELGLAGIYAESEDSAWASRISGEEARLAARYATIESNSLPSWMGVLVIYHPAAVEETLGNELIAELDDTDRQSFHSMMLQNIGHSTESVRALFVPRLRSWLERKSKAISKAMEQSGEIQRISQVAEFLAEQDGEEMGTYLAKIASEHLAENPPLSSAQVWLVYLLRFDPESGLDALEKITRDITPAGGSEAVSLLGWLFGHRGASIGTCCKRFTPRQLLRLMRILYAHVCVDDDARHEGAYSPDARDNAEEARNNIVNLLLSTKGEEGWAVKMEMSGDPYSSHFKDRILAIAEESWAEEIDGTAYTDNQAIALDQSGESPPATNEAMFRMMVNRLEEIDDLLVQPITPRESWAGITSERVMRREIARELTNRANGLYKIDQEAVTGDENETDIRLRSTVSSHEAIIELKLANKKYSVCDLIKALEDQLVKKYLAPETSRSGCLLITLSEYRTWNHPNGSGRIDFSELITLLRAEADRIIDKHGHSIRLHVHAFDFRPRLQTEKNSSKPSP